MVSVQSDRRDLSLKVPGGTQGLNSRLGSDRKGDESESY